MFLRRTNAPLRKQGGFTLLEVLLATSISLLLLGALYFALDVQTNLIQSGRNAVEGGTIARNINKRMSVDINQTVGLPDPARFRLASASSSSGSAAAGASAATGTSATGAAATATTPAATTSTSSTTTLPYFANSVMIPYGVMCPDSVTLTLYISKVPREVLYPGVNDGTSSMVSDGSGTQNYTGTNKGSAPYLCDLRRVTYWVPGGGEDSDGGTGLARMEVPVITSDDVVNMIPPNVDNEESYVIAPEVRSMTFSFWGDQGLGSGLTWNTTWDSTQTGADGVTPVGSPLAIQVTMEIAQGDGPDAPTKTYTNVLVLPATNGTTPMPTPGTTSSSSTTPGGGS